jgi:hypothetical protein
MFYRLWMTRPLSGAPGQNEGGWVGCRPGIEIVSVILRAGLGGRVRMETLALNGTVPSPCSLTGRNVDTGVKGGKIKLAENKGFRRGLYKARTPYCGLQRFFGSTS